MLGNPGKVVKKIRDEDLEANRKNAGEYVKEAKERFGVESQP